MMTSTFRRVACLGAMLALGVASGPESRPASAAQPTARHAASALAASVAPSPTIRSVDESGTGLGSILACAGCAVAAGLVVVGGPGAILVAVNSPGSALVLMGCISACYDALK